MDLYKLNLGACDRRFEGFLSVDICEPADVIADLAGPWPWEKSSVHQVMAFDVFEHLGDCDHVSPGWVCERCAAHRLGRYLPDGRMFLPHPLPLPMRAHKAKVHVMNELWRVLAPGGLAHLQIPNATQGDGGHCDPTHSSYWTQSDFEYYLPGTAERERFRNSQYYGINADFLVKNLTSAGHIPMMRYPRKLGGYVMEMQIVLEAVK